jgi:hypothetical protein
MRKNVGMFVPRATKENKMKNEEEKKIVSTTETNKDEKIRGGFIIDILKKWLGFNQLLYGTKKKF